ncbi:dipeptidylpeptidase [Coemansia sp. RSA 2559]|nr:dipeptidylpeptidase [Coemansia sp. RSA 2559]KAJ2864194.1 dipeptidylpeptidase [Coemansia erecta]
MRIAIAGTCCCALGWLATAGAAQSGAYAKNTKPLDIRVFHSLHRAGPAVVSPDATRLLLTQSRYDPDEKATATYISVVDVASGATRRLTPDAAGEAYTNPLWFDSKTFGYMHGGALHRQPVAGRSNGTALYRPAVAVSAVAYRPGRLTFVASVYPNTTSLEESRRQGEAQKARADSAQLFDNLWVRHWDEWMTPKKPNVFAVPVEEDDDAHAWTFGKEVNLMDGLPAFHDPLIRWAAEDYCVDRQGRSVAFVVRRPSDDMPAQTDVDVYLVPIDGGRPKLLTSDVQGAASAPAFSPDGTRLAWLQMEAPAYESDINRIYVHDIGSGNTTSVSRDWGLSPLALVWAADGRTIFAVAGDKGNNVVYSVDAATGSRQRLTERGSASGVRLLGSDRLVLMHSDQDKCGNVHVLDPGTRAMRQLTDINRRRLAGVYVGAAEDFWFEGARGDQVHGWLIRPPGFDAQKKYPVACLVHGGPQQYNAHTFSYTQWNPNVYASAGFVVVQINFHGSGSYGQNFTDSIACQWGGYPYEDLMKGLDHVLAAYAFVDPTRIVALGASYGGYMVNWFNANSNRFRALVSHDGLFSTPAFWYSTEELWFPEHDFGGVPYNPDARKTYDAFNPERLAANFSTPTLFVHGARDFRLSLEQSLAPFTLLRRKGVQARLMFFADENHWTTRTANSVKWYTEVLRWITTHTNTTLPYDL